MPIEIRELIIKATVTGDENGKTSIAAQPSADNGQTANEQIINICIEKILDILKDKKDR